MKDSSWLINISISLLKKILQKISFRKEILKRRADFFFAKLLGKHSSGFHHQHLPGT